MVRLVIVIAIAIVVVIAGLIIFIIETPSKYLRMKTLPSTATHTCVL